MSEPTKKILVVDDDDQVRILICRLLNLLGYRAVSEGNALAVVQRVKRENPDLVTLDMRMPGASGLEVLTAMRRENLQVPVIVISGAVDREARKECNRLGVKHILFKPVRLDELQNTLNSLFGEA